MDAWNNNYYEKLRIISEIEKKPESLITYEKYRNDEFIVLSALKKNVDVLQYAGDKLREDPKIMTSAVKLNVKSLLYASDVLQSNREFVMSVVLINPNALEYAIKFNGDKLFLINFVTKKGDTLQYLPPMFKADKDIVLAAVTRDAYSLKYADTLKGDKDVVLVAVTKDGMLLRFASDELRANKEVVLAAVNSRADALEFASDELKGDIEVIRAASNSTCAILYASEQVIRDQLPDLVEKYNECASKKKEEALEKYREENGYGSYGGSRKRTRRTRRRKRTRRFYKK